MGNPDPDPGRPKVSPKKGKYEEIFTFESFLLGWRFLLKPECPL
jgi:hypothetical protein